MEINNFRRNSMKSLAKEQQGSYEMQKYVVFVKENLEIKIIVKSEIIIIIQGNIQKFCAQQM